MKRHHKLNQESKFCYTVLIILAIFCLLPFWLIIVASFTPEVEVTKFGYRMWTSNPTLDTFKFLLMNKGVTLLKAFGVTLLVTVLGTAFSLFVTTTFAYTISQKKEVYRFSRVLSFVGWFTMIFSGGTLPWYILCTQYYGLKNNIFALFVPYCISVWNAFILRGNFRNIPEEILEAAKLDGASDAQTFVRVSIPLAKAGIVTIALFNMLTFWNDFYLPTWLVLKNDLLTLQKMLYNMLTNSLALLKDPDIAGVFSQLPMPTETAKMAVAVLTIVPVLAIYPFSLKYFVKGINMGGVKG